MEVLCRYCKSVVIASTWICYLVWEFQASPLKMSFDSYSRYVDYSDKHVMSDRSSATQNTDTSYSQSDHSRDWFLADGPSIRRPPRSVPQSPYKLTSDEGYFSHMNASYGALPAHDSSQQRHSGLSTAEGLPGISEPPRSDWSPPKSYQGQKDDDHRSAYVARAWTPDQLPWELDLLATDTNTFRTDLSQSYGTPTIDAWESDFNNSQNHRYSYSSMNSTDHLQSFSQAAIGSGPSTATRASNGFAEPSEGLHRSNDQRSSRSHSPEMDGQQDLKNISPRNYWTPIEDDLLLKVVSHYRKTFSHPLPWSKISEAIPNRSATICSKRYNTLLLRQGRYRQIRFTLGLWTAEEDQDLLEVMAKYKVSKESSKDGHIPWARIGMSLKKPRTGLQVCARFTEALDPTVKRGRWSREEDQSLYDAYQLYGPRWTLVRDKVHGRTQRQCRSRWNVLLQYNMTSAGCLP